MKNLLAEKEKDKDNLDEEDEESDDSDTDEDMKKKKKITSKEIQKMLKKIHVISTMMLQCLHLRILHLK